MGLWSRSKSSKQGAASRLCAEAKDEKTFIQDLQKLRDVPCKTPDGHSFALWVNTGLRQTVASLKVVLRQ